MEKEGIKLREYVCPKCGFIYNPKDGYPERGIKPGTPFEQLPADFRCPICGLPKWQFERADEYYK